MNSIMLVHLHKANHTTGMNRIKTVMKLAKGGMNGVSQFAFFLFPSWIRRGGFADRRRRGGGIFSFCISSVLAELCSVNFLVLSSSYFFRKSTKRKPVLDSARTDK
jgi:hypothetical protein